MIVLIDLILAAIFVLIITAIICTIFDGAFTESVLIGILILIFATQKLDSLRLVNIAPISSLVITAAIISISGIFLAMVIHKVTH